MTLIPSPLSVQILREELEKNPDGIPFNIPKASGDGYVLNDRDVLVCTSEVSPVKAFEDLFVNPVNHERTGWGEVRLVGVYKRSDASDPHGSHEVCTSQGDADSNACLTVLDYCAKEMNPSGPSPVVAQPIAYEIKGGSLYVDMTKVGLGAGMDNIKAHQIYAVAAPDLPVAMGGQLRFFDGYLAGWEQAWMPAESTNAMRITPHPQVPGVSIIRVWIYYTPGWKGCHILRLKCYRKEF